MAWMSALRLATFNVCGLPSALPPFARRAAGFCRRIEEADLDVVVFQEVWLGRSLATLRAHLPSFPYVGRRRGPAGQPAGGLATFSRLPIGNVRYRSFRGARPDAGSPRFRLMCAVNAALQGVLTVELAGRGTVVANTHLSANRDGDWSAANRHHTFQRAQLRMLHAALPAAGRHTVIVAGDFNIASAGALYPLVIDAWHDPFAATDPVTYHAEFLPPGAALHRIDYVLVRGDARVTDCGILIGDPGLSDHLALYADLALTGD
jgi:endonuclease/exonuclease/phosphatase family metal-dependent hydrolase